MSRIRATLAFLGLMERPRKVSALNDPEIEQLRRDVQSAGYAPVAAALARTRNWARRAHLLDGIVDWPTRPAWMDEWVRHRRSAEALLVRGAHAIQWAWQARGGGWTDTVTDEGWRLFFQRLQLAHTDLQEAAELSPDDPTVWTQLIICARGLQLERDQHRTYFKNAVRCDPLNLDAHQQMLQNLCEKWGGSDEKMLEFARKAAARDAHRGRLSVLVLEAHAEIFYTAARAGEKLALEYLRRADVRNEVMRAAAAILQAPGDENDLDRVSALGTVAAMMDLFSEHEIATRAFNELRGRVTGMWRLREKPIWDFRLARLVNAFSSRGAANVLETAERVHRTYWKWKLRLGVAVLMLLGAYLLIQRLGPTAAPPTQSPLTELEEKWREMPDNARVYYARAADGMSAPPIRAWTDYAKRGKTALPQELVAWVNDNEAAIPQIRKAVATPNCFLPVSLMRSNAAPDVAMRVRDLARWIALRARVAAQNRDLATFEESLGFLRAIATHMFQTESIVAHLQGCAVTGVLEDLRLWPMEWTELPIDQQRGYLDRSRAVRVDIPSLAPAIEMDVQDAGVAHIHEGSAALSLIAPPPRTYYELQTAAQPLLELAKAPAETHLDQNSPLVSAAAETRSGRRRSGAIRLMCRGILAGRSCRRRAAHSSCGPRLSRCNAASP